MLNNSVFSSFVIRETFTAKGKVKTTDVDKRIEGYLKSCCRKGTLFCALIFSVPLTAKSLR
jgi:hypothetical protein